VQVVEPIKPTLKPPATKRLKLKYDELLSSFPFNGNLRRYVEGGPKKITPFFIPYAITNMVGRCRLTLSNPS
jgi:hypothetical protein